MNDNSWNPRLSTSELILRTYSAYALLTIRLIWRFTTKIYTIEDVKFCIYNNYKMIHLLSESKVGFNWKMVRLKCAKLLTVLVLLLNAILLFYTWKWFLSSESNQTVGAKLTNAGNKQKDRNKHIKKAITIIFRDFYNFENDLHNSIDSILNLIPNIQILVIYEDEPYPPLLWVSNFTASHLNVKFINMNFDIRKTFKALSPLLQIRTKYVLFVPGIIT